jgi:predicted small metal-binding protein
MRGGMRRPGRPMADSKKKISHQTSNEMERGTINPSAPTAGTEGWANHAEARNSENSREASSPDARGAGDPRYQTYPGNEASSNPAAHHASDQPPGEDRERMFEDNPNYRAGKSFRCADVGVENCNWSVTGTREDEIIGNVRAHAKSQHGISEHEFDGKMKDRVRGAIRQRAA